MNEEQLAKASEEIQELREEIREDLAVDLGGEADDYRSDRHFRDSNTDEEAVTDGGE